IMIVAHDACHNCNCCERPDDQWRLQTSANRGKIGEDWNPATEYVRLTEKASGSHSPTRFGSAKRIMTKTTNTKINKRSPVSSGFVSGDLICLADPLLPMSKALSRLRLSEVRLPGHRLRTKFATLIRWTV